MHATLCDQLQDLVQNGLEAGATQITVTWRDRGRMWEITVEDNGCGMSAAVQMRALDPFFTDGQKHRHRKVGLGLAFLRQLAETTGGQWMLTSEEGQGTTIGLVLLRDHVDMPPMGDLAVAVTAWLGFEGDYELVFRRETQAGAYTISRRALQEALGELETASSLALARAYIASQEDEKGNKNGSTDT